MLLILFSQTVVRKSFSVSKLSEDPAVQRYIEFLQAESSVRHAVGTRANRFLVVSITMEETFSCPKWIDLCFSIRAMTALDGNFDPNIAENVFVNNVRLDSRQTRLGRGLGAVQFRIQQQRADYSVVLRAVWAAMFAYNVEAALFVEDDVRNCTALDRLHDLSRDATGPCGNGAQLCMLGYGFGAVYGSQNAWQVYIEDLIFLDKSAPWEGGTWSPLRTKPVDSILYQRPITIIQPYAFEHVPAVNPGRLHTADATAACFARCRDQAIPDRSVLNYQDVPAFSAHAHCESRFMCQEKDEGTLQRMREAGCKMSLPIGN